MKIGNGQNIPFATPEGGLAVRLINDTGETSVKGKIVHPSNSVDNAVSLVPVDDVDCMGVIYESGIPDGEMMTVVFSGMVKVFFVDSTTREHFARICVAADTNAENGKAISEPVPTPPLSTDKHFREIGHILESRVGAGLANVMLHFN